MKILKLLLLIICISSCRESDKDRITRLVSEWQGKEIIFPDSIVFTKYISDTTDWKIPESDYKILVYVDSIGCTSCKLQLSKWKELIAYTETISEGTIPFLFFFHAGNYKEILYLLKRDQFDLPVCIDKEDRLNKLNGFPSDITFQTFMLDKDNRVVVLGNPIHNTAVKDLYLNQISGKSQSSNKAITTTATVTVSEIDFGTFNKEEIKKGTFLVKNTGENPLVILDVATTCGCATAYFDKKPAQAGESLSLEVTMKPKESGFFNETFTVKCNTDNHIKLTVRGQAQ